MSIYDLLVISGLPPILDEPFSPQWRGARPMPAWLGT